MDSYGYIETYGYVTSIVAADEALKAADVTLTNLYVVSGGLVTVEFAGDVAAVSAAIEVGAECAKRLGNYLGSNVIARLDKEVKNAIVNKNINKNKKLDVVVENSQEDSILNDKKLEEKKENLTLVYDEKLEVETQIQNNINFENENQNEINPEIETQIQDENNVEIETQVETNIQNDEEIQVQNNNEVEVQKEVEIGTEEFKNETKEEYSEEKENIKKLRRKYQDMRVIELKTRVNNLKTEHTWNQIKAMTKKKLIEILIRHDQEE